MIVRPQVVLGGYVEGVRKRYVNPFTFFVIGMTISLVLFNQFDKQYLELAMLPAMAQIEEDIEEAGGLEAYEAKLRETKNPMGQSKEEIIAFNENVQKQVVKYYNLLALILMPLYALLAWLVFRKPLNYAEHLIVGLYIQGVTFWGTTITFTIAVLTKATEVFYLSIVSTIIYYLYAYTRLYELSPGKIVLSLLKFLVWLIVLIFAAALIGIVTGFIIGFLMVMTEKIQIN